MFKTSFLLSFTQKRYVNIFTSLFMLISNDCLMPVLLLLRDLTLLLSQKTFLYAFYNSLISNISSNTWWCGKPNNMFKEYISWHELSQYEYINKVNVSQFDNFMINTDFYTSFYDICWQLSFEWLKFFISKKS